MYNKIGIVIKPPHKEIGKIVKTYLLETIGILKELNKNIILETIASGLLGQENGVDRGEIASLSDIIIIIGGDGTFLSVAKDAAHNNIPVVGFNMGTLGFLTEFNIGQLKGELNGILNGKYRISERKLLKLDYKNENISALNDIVVSKGDIARVIKFTLIIDDDPIADITADGLIVSTPTGSTAYSLSAGGPIITPEVTGTIITPICPHSLTFRPIIIPDRSEIKVKQISDNTEVFITIDGQKKIPFIYGDIIKISSCNKKLKMVSQNDLSYFNLLSEKLKWGL